MKGSQTDDVSCLLKFTRSVGIIFNKVSGNAFTLKTISVIDSNLFSIFQIVVVFDYQQVQPMIIF